MMMEEKDDNDDDDDDDDDENYDYSFASTEEPYISTEPFERHKPQFLCC